MYIRRIYTYIIHIRKQIHKSSEGGEMGTTLTHTHKKKTTSEVSHTSLPKRPQKARAHTHTQTYTLLRKHLLLGYLPVSPEAEEFKDAGHLPENSFEDLDAHAHVT